MRANVLNVLIDPKGQTDHRVVKLTLYPNNGNDNNCFDRHDSQFFINKEISKI